MELLETVVVAPIERDVVIVEGPDARTYLQSQLTQDVESLALGGSAWSFILDPKSSIEAFVRVTRFGQDRLAIDVEAGFGHRVRERLDGLLFRTDVSFGEATWPGLAWRGPGALSRGYDAPVVSRVPWPGVESLDVLGPGVVVPDGAPAVDAATLQHLRIRAGWPEMGFEIGPGITPAMTGLVEVAVSFEKGCYTGQELVARTYHRGAAPTKRLVRVTSADQLARGDRIRVDGDDVGEVTSASGHEAIGYLARRVEVPAPVDVGGKQAIVSPIVP
jgi:folate-binding protein YgfZ